MNNLTKKQLIANRKNAKLGGVKTEPGKNKVKFNALKHGILSNTISKYEEDINQQLLAQLYQEFKPKDFIEEFLTERVALYYLKLYRAGKAENEFLKSCIDPTNSESLKEALNVGFGKKGYQPVVNFEHVHVLQNTYHRYEKSLENRLYKALKILKRHKNSQ